jgi:hypothetical protein
VNRPRPADPYRPFPFRIRFGRDAAAPLVAGFQKARLLNAPRSAGAGNDLTFEQGLTCDAAFDRWCAAAAAPALAPDVTAPRDLVVELLDPAGQIARAFRAVGCGVRTYQALADLDAGSTSVAIEALSLTATRIEPLPK